MDSFSKILAILGFTLAIACFAELKKTKKILSKYVNEEDKALLLAKENPKKRIQYTTIMICLLLIIILMSYFARVYVNEIY